MLMDKCLASLKERLKRESYHLESVQLVRALDKVSGKLQAMDQLLPSADLSRYACVCVVSVLFAELVLVFFSYAARGESW